MFYTFFWSLEFSKEVFHSVIFAKCPVGGIIAVISYLLGHLLEA